MLNSFMRKKVTGFGLVWSVPYAHRTHQVTTKEHGVFLRDPHLKQFLKSGRAACASLRILEGFFGNLTVAFPQRENLSDNLA